MRWRSRFLEAHPAVRAPFPGWVIRARSHAPAVGLGGAGFLRREGRRPPACATRHRDDSPKSDIATNLGDTKSIITHPATTSHGRLTEEQRQAAGIGQGLIRLAVGLEHVDDIKADLLRGLDKL
jgi:O-succinylhomoserine sulfhydrylase